MYYEIDRVKAQLFDTRAALKQSDADIEDLKKRLCQLKTQLDTAQNLAQRYSRYYDLAAQTLQDAYEVGADYEAQIISLKKICLAQAKYIQEFQPGAE